MKFKYQKYIFLSLFILPVCIYGQIFSGFSGGAGPTGAGQTGVSWSNEWAALNNQAGILATENWGFAASVSSLYSFSELPVLSSSLTKSINQNSAIALSFKYFGDQDLNLQLIGLAYARRILKEWDLSLQFDLVGYKTAAYGSRYTGTLELGSMIHASNKLDIGFHVFNPVSVSLTENEDIPSIVRLGAIYDVSTKVKLMAELEKELAGLLAFKAGVDYELFPSFSLRTGISTGGRQFFAGFSYRFGASAVAGAFSWHNRLGFTPTVGYTFDK